MRLPKFSLKNTRHDPAPSLMRHSRTEDLRRNAEVLFCPLTIDEVVDYLRKICTWVTLIIHNGSAIMARYIVRELQNAKSCRKGEVVEASSLSTAKRMATVKQVFQGTVLKIEHENGEVASIKENGKWRDVR